MKNKLIYVLLVATLISYNVVAEDFIDEDVIVVSASKIEQNIESSVEKVNVVSADELEKKGSKTIAEALLSIPGVTVTKSALNNKSSSVMMQGFDGQYVKILIDGVAVDGENGGAVYLERIPLENVERIEIVQGATSSLYGSDAMGGVINIITKKTQEESALFSGNVSEDFASSLQSKTSLGLNFNTNGFFASTNGSFDWHKGCTETISDEKIGSVDKTKVPETTLGYADAKIGYKADTWNISFDGFFTDYVRNTTNIGTSKKSKYISKNNYSEKRFSGTLRGQKDFSETLSLKGYLNGKIYNAKLDETKLFSTTADSDVDSKNKVLESELQSSWTPNNYNALVCGLYGMFEVEEGSSFEDLKKQGLLSLFAQDTIDFTGGEEKLLLSLGGRLDLEPGTDGSKALFQATPKASIKYSPFESTAIRFGYGMGYKLPSLKQKYYVKYHSHGNTGFYIYGNKDLKSEYSHSFNLNLDQKIGSNIQLNAGAFYNMHKNLIDSQKVVLDDSSYFYQYKNVEKAYTYGGTFGIAGKFDRLDLNANYAYTVAKQYNGDDVFDLTFRVPHRITASLSYMIPVIETQLSLDGEWNSPQASSDTGDEHTPDLLLLNMTARKKFLNDSLEVFVRAENLLNTVHFKNGTNDENQEEYFSLYDGLLFHFGLRYKF